MADSYIEDDGSEFPINNCVQCGQAEYMPGFGENRVRVAKLKSKVPRTEKANFLPKRMPSSRK
ncbi:hypothetical protein PS943_00766 [Pseudomonas fluorescens]|uniref:Uncharacterized protein n=1 Tax=Pseudomonas fluorescens TaxID=294 RepID=A0A5E7VZX6_PSEFL|nr:hypothetical protein [Pseudomonas fluorescens]VVQ28216.1 hypothetical protein PS943_00766 [Pseudomonas fluorescens]